LNPPQLISRWPRETEHPFIIFKFSERSKRRFTLACRLNRLPCHRAHHRIVEVTGHRVGKMSARTVGVFLAALFLTQAASAQDLRAPHANRNSAQSASNDSLDAGVARIAVRAVITSPSPPAQKDLLGIFVLLSLRQNRGHGA